MSFRSGIKMKYSTLTEAIVKTKRKSGEPVIPITRYWNAAIKVLDYKYAIAIPDIYGNKGVCPLHDDRTPSFGIVRGRDGVERFNCFGCQEFGHLIDLHRAISSKYKKKNMSPEEAAIDILRYFKLPLDSFRDLVKSDVSDLIKEKNSKDRHIRTSLAIREATKSYTIHDYNKEVIAGVRAGKDFKHFNGLLYRATLKLTD